MRGEAGSAIGRCASEAIGSGSNNSSLINAATPIASPSIDELKYGAEANQHPRSPTIVLNHSISIDYLSQDRFAL